MPLLFPDGTAFSNGAMTYQFRPATRGEKYERLVVTIFVGPFATTAVVDTGGVFFICTPELGKQLGLDPQRGAPTDKLYLRGRTLEGSLHPLEIELAAQDGETLIVTVTAFLPHLRAGEEWSEEFPCIMGLYGCLERLRFAVDPVTETFYFGAAQ